MEVPKRAIKFSANDSFTPFYQNLFSTPTLTQPLAILTGASAGATESLVVVPFELLKIRLQDKTSASRYTGLLDCSVKVVRQEGPLALYNGFEATLWRHIVWNAGYFGCIFQVRAQLSAPATSSNPTRQKMGNDLIAGFVGGVVGTTFNTPLDVVKSRIQSVAKTPGVRQKYAWAWPSLGVVAREEGFRALYKGRAREAARTVPYVRIKWYTSFIELTVSSDTRERPYECPTCKKHFSRSDVLFRHCKGHAQNAMNRMKSNEQQTSPDQQDFRHNSLDESQTTRPSAPRNGNGPTPGPTPVIREEHAFSPMVQRRDSQVLQVNGNQYNTHLSPPLHTRQTSSRLQPPSPGEDRIEALINAAQHLEPGTDTPWRSPSPMIMARPDNTQMSNRNPHESMGPPIDPAMEALTFSPAAHVSSLDQWAFELVQSNNPVPNRTPADALQTWLFPLEADMQTPHGSHHLGVDGFFDPETFRPIPGNEPSPSGSSVSIASRVPRERFQRVQSCWPSRSRRSSRLMPDLWQSLIASECSNILSEVGAGAVETPMSERERRNSRWGLDEECRSRLQSAMDNMPLPNQSRSESYGDTASSSGDAAASPSVESVQFPPAEILDIALEMYLYYFHPTLPIIHIPTFSARNAPRPLLLCMCLIGLSILGTAGAAKFVTRTFPAVLQLATTELHTLQTTDHPPHRQMCIIATSLLALNLASITGRKSRIAQAEKMYGELIGFAQSQGLFSANEGVKIDPLLDETIDIDAKWKAWSKIECTKRVIFGLIEADCWWASYLSACPMIRPETVQMLPPSDYALYHVNSAAKWFRLVQRGARIQANRITPSFHPTPGLKLDASSFRSLLTLLLLRIYESNDRLAPATSNQKQLEPWRIYMEDPRSRDILPLLVNLSSSSVDALRTADLNSAVLWHASCMVLGANIRYFELAAGRSGPEPAVNALEDISAWSQTPSARRSVLHAAHIYKLLFDRKVSDIVNPHSVVSLFRAALVLGLYIFTVPPIQNGSMNDNCLELLDLVDWMSIGRLGFIDTPQSPVPFGDASLVVKFIRHGGPFSITGVTLDGGYLAARRTLLHCADLMEGLWGRG
ncbi:C2H2 type zinc finger domain containing protein [Pyrenophora tritici-repentis]|nr:C2H2 type zinc finger domain containing protein [Pyrenophora tritici-repentis]